MIRPHGVGLYAPSGFAIDPDAVDRAVQRLEAMWERVVVDPTCRSRWQRFSAPDEERLAAVVRMANDPRVDPMNSRKMVARLQAANASTHPILLRASSTSGHGIGTAFSEAIAQQTDVFAFLFDQLGVRYR